jgi:hypothetical protein
LQKSEHSLQKPTLEVVFVVLEEKLANFRISTVSGRGRLRSFPGWERGNEESKVKILGIKGWD